MLAIRINQNYIIIFKREFGIESVLELIHTNKLADFIKKRYTISHLACQFSNYAVAAASYQI